MVDGLNLYSYVQGNPIASADFLGLLRDCDKEQIQCFRKCWRRKPPYPMENHKGSHYRYCQSKCLAQYMACLAANAAEEAGDLINECVEETGDWIDGHFPNTLRQDPTTRYWFILGGVVVIILIPGPQPI